MSELTTKIRLAAASAVLVAFGVVVSGCGTSTADTERGRELFIQNCGTCHAMAQAGTSAQVGPDLDDAFAAARASGQNDATIRGITEAQIEYPRPSTDNPANSMPADIVTGQDMRDVAAYVGEWAGVPGAEPPQVEGGPGAQVFANYGCGGCHTLAAAETGGTTGPDLDKVLPGQSKAMIEESIVEPNAKLEGDYPADVMPSTYGQDLSDEELQQLVDFLAKSTSKGGGPE